MGRTVYKNSTEEEKSFFENFSSNANISDDFQNFIKYGFFHFTSVENLKKSRTGVEGEGIEKKGINADIGEHSEGFETQKRAYYSIGAEGVMGLVNRVIFLSIVKLIEEKGMNPDEAKQLAFKNAKKTFNNSVYLKMNIEDGIEYDSNDFMTLRNSHTISDKNIPPEKLELVTVNDSSNALDVLEFFYSNCDSAKIRLNSHVQNGKEYIEENYIEDFMEFVRNNRKKENEKFTEISSSLKKLDLSEKKKIYEESNLAFGNNDMEQLAKTFLREGMRSSEVSQIGKTTSKLLETTNEQDRKIDE